MEFNFSDFFTSGGNVYQKYDFQHLPLYKPHEVFKGYNLCIKQCGSLFSVRLYQNKQYKQYKGVEDAKLSHKQVKSAIINSCSKSLDVARRSLNCTRQKVFDIVRCNADIWQSFITLTFSPNTVTTKFGQHFEAFPDASDISLCNEKLNIFITNTKRDYPDFKYIGVWERQKNGNIHYHLLCNKTFDGFTRSLDGKRGIRHISIKRWIYGISDCMLLSECDNKFDPALYMCKYMLKEQLNNYIFGVHRMFCSHGLARPVFSYGICEVITCQELYNLIQSMYKERIEKSMHACICASYNVCYATFTEVKFDFSSWGKLHESNMDGKRLP